MLHMPNSQEQRNVLLIDTNSLPTPGGETKYLAQTILAYTRPSAYQQVKDNLKISNQCCCRRLLFKHQVLLYQLAVTGELLNLLHV